MTIYLVRHTEYFNPENIFPFELPVYLTKAGREHAGRVGSWLQANARSKPIYTSPVVRTVQTAEIIASHTNSFVIVDARLTEVRNDRLKGVKKPLQNSLEIEYDFTTRETIESIRQRVVECFYDKVKEGIDCIMVSHGDPLTILLYHLKKTPCLEDFFKPNAEEEYVKRGEIIKVIVENNKYQIERIIV